MPKDKSLHLLAGPTLAIITWLLFYPLIGLAAAAVVGALKEIIWDWLLKRERLSFWILWPRWRVGSSGQ